LYNKLKTKNMKKFLLITLVGFMMLFVACDDRPMNSSYDDNSYDQVQQQPILVNQGGNSFLMDYLLYQSLMQRHINPYHYYSTHRNDVRIHVSNSSGGFRGYRGGYARTYRPMVSRTSYTRSGSSSFGKRSYSTSSPRRNSSSFSSSSSRRSSFGGSSYSSRSSRSSFGSSSSRSSRRR
jgi:hypothetical protein